MCRLLGYLGLPLQLDQILSQPKHSLIVQSYQPREMAEALLNADGFGFGWYHPTQKTEPFIYKNTLPIWNDTNVPSLSRYIESNRIVGYIRSATPGQAVSLSNCQPFQHQQLLYTHNGYIDNFRQSLYRPICDRLRDTTYQLIHGSTDSEHLFGLFLNEFTSAATPTLAEALYSTLMILTQLAERAAVKVLANMVICDGHQMVASRYAIAGVAPSLYWIKNDPNFPQSVIIASEPLFAGNWQQCPEQSIIRVEDNLDVHIQKLA